MALRFFIYPIVSQSLNLSSKLINYVIVRDALKVCNIHFELRVPHNAVNSIPGSSNRRSRLEPP